ncbi:MAG TPA: ATP-binding protein [Ktedonobacteraceae bacterium]|jgi:hypothetical protein
MAGGDRTAGISIKSHKQVTESGFSDNFIKIAWAQWFGYDDSRKVKDSNDAIVLVTGDIAPGVKSAWSDLLREILSATPAPDRIVARLSVPKEGEGSQTSILERNLFNSFHCPQKFKQYGKIDEVETVRLLGHIRLLDFDYENPTSQDRVRALSDCQHILRSGDAKQALELWERLEGIAKAKRSGGSIDLAGLMAALRGAFDFREHPDYQSDWDILDRYSKEAMNDVYTEIPGIPSLDRDEERATIQDNLDKYNTCFLVGESGSGKSALAKVIAQANYQQVIWFSANMLAYDTSVQFERNMGLRHALGEILSAASHSCLIVFDGIEGYSPQVLRLTARIIEEVRTHDSLDHIYLLFTVHFETAESTMRKLAGLGCDLPPLDKAAISRRPSENEIRYLLAQFPKLRWASLRPELCPLLTNLKILDWVIRVSQSGKALDNTILSLTTLIDWLWAYWVEGDDSDNLARAQLLKRMAILEAETLYTSVAPGQLGHAEQHTLHALIKSDLLRRRDERLSFSHDLLGDWARMKVLVEQEPTASTAHRDRAATPRWHRAVRLYGQRLLEKSSSGDQWWHESLRQLDDGSETGQILRDLLLESLFVANNAAELLERVWPVLASNNGELLARLLDRFLFTATLPDSYRLSFVKTPEMAVRLEYAFRRPFWPYWGPVLTFLYAHREEIVRITPIPAAKVCSMWLEKMPIKDSNGQSILWRQEAAKLAIAIACELQARDEEDNPFGNSQDQVVYEALLYAAPDLSEEVSTLCLELAQRRDLSPAIQARVIAARQKRAEERKQDAHSASVPVLPIFPPPGAMREPWPDGPRKRIAQGFRNACLDTDAFSALVQSKPEVALEVLLAVCIQKPSRENPYRSPRPDDEGFVEYWHGGYPPLYFRGPFLLFLRNAPEHGFSFILRLVNFATRCSVEARMKWLRSQGNHRKRKDGTVFIIEGQPRKWLGDYRTFQWHNSGPHNAHIVTCALMALEKWLYEQIDQEIDVQPYLSRIIAESESMAFAGLLLDVGKKNPALFLKVLKPLFSVWELYDLDTPIVAQKGGSELGLLAWGLQSSTFMDLAKEWYGLPHRAILFQNVAITMMFSVKDLQPFFAELRDNWKKQLDEKGQPNNLRLLVEHLNPDNYTLTPVENGISQAEFHWPEDIERENEISLQQRQEQWQLMSLPWRCRDLLDKDTPLPPQQILYLWERLQTLDNSSPTVPEESGYQILNLEDAVCGGIAVLLTFHREWLVADPNRMAWCRQKLEEVIRNPPAWTPLDSEVSIGNHHWDAFIAECGVALLTENSNDHFARYLVALGVAAFHYETTTLTMIRAFRYRDKLRDDFDRLQNLVIQWAALNGQKYANYRLSDADTLDWDKKYNELLQSFIDRSLSTKRPSLQEINTAALAEAEKLRIQQFPDRGTGTRKSRKKYRGRREVLRPNPPGIDLNILTHAFTWINIKSATSPVERLKWLALIKEFLNLSLASVPFVADPAHQEIDSFPSDFDDWIYEQVAEAIPCMTSAETPDSLWKPILGLGAPAHYWVERFLSRWFTRGVFAVSAPEPFLELWIKMIRYALSHPLWDMEQNRTHYLNEIVCELLGLNVGFSIIGNNENFTGYIGKMADVYAMAAKKWFVMPRVVLSFAKFVVQPAIRHLLLPAIYWLADATRSFQEYHWREHGLKGSLTEFLRVCWENQEQKISSDSDLQKAFLSLLVTLSAHGDHATIALRDHILNSISSK